MTTMARTPLSIPTNSNPALPDFDKLSPGAARSRRREWNRMPLEDLFPKIPPSALDRLLDICIDKNVTYNLSESKRWNARRYSSIAVAHVRHFYTDYDRRLRDEHEERFAARRATGDRVWKILREWCPWDEANDQLERCFQVTLVPAEQRGAEWDPMDIDDESFYTSSSSAAGVEAEMEIVDDPMDLD